MHGTVLELDALSRDARSAFRITLHSGDVRALVEAADAALTVVYDVEVWKMEPG